MTVAQQLKHLEEELLQPSVRRDTASVAAVLAEEFLEFGSSGGSFTKAEILESLRSEPARQIALDDFDCLQLEAGLALVTYRSIRNQPENPPAESLRSSIWVHRSGRWQMVFHHGTRCSSR